MTVTPEHSSTTYYIPLEVRLSQGSPAAHICHELVVGVFLRGVVFHDAGLSLSCQAHYMLVCNVRALSVVGRRVSVFTNCSVETIPPSLTNRLPQRAADDRPLPAGRARDRALQLQTDTLYLSLRSDILLFILCPIRGDLASPDYANGAALERPGNSPSVLEVACYNTIVKR